MHQATFQFDPPVANRSYTSSVAARRIKPHASAQRDLILAYLRRHPEGEIREAIGIALKIKGDSLRPRVDELKKAGLIEETMLTRPTLSGRAAFVLVAK